MKKLKISALAIATVILLSFAAGCGAGNNRAPVSDEKNDDVNATVGQTPHKDSDVGAFENPFVSTADNPISTLSADVDTASYAYFRKLCNLGYSLTDLKNQMKGSPLRTEEMVNYFDYSYTMPAEGEIFGVKAEIAKTPWNENSHLLTVGIATSKSTERIPNNLVFLIDVSGSMSSSDKLPLLKKAFGSLVSALDEHDTVSIVTYSGKEEVVLSGCSGNKTDEIMAAVNALVPSGSTNGEAGLTKAYALAKDYYKENGNNRIILASDGDLNVGISSPEELKSYISEKRDEGIYLSVLGFGTGNYKDSAMSAIAQNGNGVYYYIDGESEAQKVLGTDILSTLYTVAKDVKLQLTFDPAFVSSYRLIGYENRILNTEDFLDDTKDAGDVGAGHSVTVCYELILTDGATEEYSEPSKFASLGISYKLPSESESILEEYSIDSGSVTDTPSSDFTFISAVIETAMIINESKYNEKNVGLSDVRALINSADISGDADKSEFLQILTKLSEDK